MARTSGSRATETGPRIRAAALRLFAREGYAAVSMRRIAAEVGVQVGALYNYTPDKQTLLADLMEDHLSELSAALEAEALPEDPAAALEGFIRFHIRFHAHRPDAVFIAYMELRNLNEENFARIEGLRRDYEAQLEAILRRGAEAGVFDLPDVRIGALAVIGMLTGMTTWYRSRGRLSLEEIEEIYVEMARRSVGG